MSYIDHVFLEELEFIFGKDVVDKATDDAAIVRSRVYEMQKILDPKLGEISSVPPVELVYAVIIKRLSIPQGHDFKCDVNPVTLTWTKSILGEKGRVCIDCAKRITKPDLAITKEQNNGK